MGSKKKFIASINIIDNDYRSLCGCKDIYVDSWQEAKDYCDSSSWTGERYLLDYLMDRETKKFLNTEKECLNFIVEDDLKHNKTPTNTLFQPEWSYW